MTDNEIKKALECCGRNSIARWLNDCKNCPLNDRTTCIPELMYKAKDLINRLQAENECWQAAYMTEKQEIANLEIELKAMRGAANSYKAENEEYKKIKTTIDEFWEILLTLSLFKRKEKPTLEEFAEAIQEIKAEAYKKGAEDFVKKFKDELPKEFDEGLCFAISCGLDSLYKELVGDGNTGENTIKNEKNL